MECIGKGKARRPYEFGVKVSSQYPRSAAAPGSPGLRVYTAGQKHGVTDKIKHELRGRSAVEAVIGHMKEEHRMARNHLAGQRGDAVNPLKAGIGYNFRLLLAWLPVLWRALLALVVRTEILSQSQRYAASTAFFTDDYASRHGGQKRRLASIISKIPSGVDDWAFQPIRRLLMGGYF